MTRDSGFGETLANYIGQANYVAAVSTPTFIGTVTIPALAMQRTGAAATIGTATLVAGSVIVSTTAVTTNDNVFLTRKTSGGTIGTAITYTINSGATFTINSDNPLDTSTFSWLVVKTN